MIFSGGYTPPAAPKIGDKVIVITKRTDRDLTGWVLNVTESSIRVAAEQADDGRPNPPADWWRATLLLSEVQVLVC